MACLLTPVGSALPTPQPGGQTHCPVPHAALLLHQHCCPGTSATARAAEPPLAQVQRHTESSQLVWVLAPLRNESPAIRHLRWSKQEQHPYTTSSSRITSLSQARCSSSQIYQASSKELLSKS